MFRRWLTLSRVTITRWVSRVRAEIDRATARGEIVPPLEQILRTDRQVAVTDSRRKRTPELEDAVRSLYLTPAAPTATVVRRKLKDQLGLDISARTVQRICQEIPDHNRALARGGPAAARVILDKHYLRFADKPNGLWTIDNSWIGKELIGIPPVWWTPG